MSDKNMIIDEEKEQMTRVLSDEEIQEEINSLINVSDEEILKSLELAEKEKKKAGRKKTATSIKGETIINNFLQDRSEQNWKALQEFFWYGIRQYAYNKLKEYGYKDSDVAYDMAIEAFINAYNSIDSYDPNIAKFSTWLWTICRNNCLGYVKRKARMNIVDNDLSDIYDSELECASYRQNHSEFENGVFEGSDFHSSDFSNVTQTLYDVSISEMKHIPGISGQILHMKLVEGKKIREIAVELSMNESTVKNHLYRGKENLKRILSINHKELVDTYKDMDNAIDIA